MTPRLPHSHFHPNTHNSTKISPFFHNNYFLHISHNAGKHPPFLSSLISHPPMATSISATLSSSFHGTWGTSISGEDAAVLIRPAPAAVRVARPVRFRPMMKNINEGKGLFAPIVVLARNVIGKKQFNQLRGKAIALHSQIITEFCKSIGADAKQRQGLIRLAKKNGERLGFLA